MSLNKVLLIGNVGKDPDVRYFDSGSAVANFPLATSERGYTLANARAYGVAQHRGTPRPGAVRGAVGPEGIVALRGREDTHSQL